jgi:hypothetical protein
MAVTGRADSKRPFSSAWVPGPVIVLLGLGAHLVSGGDAPAASILVALTALLSLSASMLARLRMPGWALPVLCGLAQQVLHLAFGAFSGSSGGGPAGHGHGSAARPAPQLPGLAETPGPDLHLMVHAHVGAALLTVLIITQGTRLVSRIRPVRNKRRVDGPRRAGPAES